MERDGVLGPWSSGVFLWRDSVWRELKENDNIEINIMRDIELPENVFEWVENCGWDAVVLKDKILLLWSQDEPGKD